jgi:type I restriction enzyme S subunit
MIHYKSYPAYKDSSVEWLGRVPAHWKIKKLKWLACLQSGEFITSESIESEGEYPVFGGNGLRGYTAAPTHEGHYALIGRQGALCGNINYAHGKFWASEHAVVVSPRELVNVKWLGEVLRSMNLNQYSVSAAQPGLAVERVIDLHVPVPPWDEQDDIAVFLEVETARIDGLVSRKTRFIELLREKRQALISHAVTKGLDPDAPLKDSGVEWLGMVPAHWDVTPLKYLATFRSGGTPSKENMDFWDGDIPWASAKDLKRDQLYDTADHVTDLALHSGAAALVAKGSILVVVRGMILARLFPVVEAMVPMAINQDLKALTAAAALHDQFLANLLRGLATESLRRLEEAGHGTKALRMERWSSMQLPVPPLAEQQNILDFIGLENDQIDTLISKTEGSIKLLAERRSALITAAVTGQIDLRKAA